MAICAGNSLVTGEFPAQRPAMRSLDVFFDLRLNKRLSKSREADDLRHRRVHYDDTVMFAVDSIIYLIDLDKYDKYIHVWVIRA